MAIAYLTEDTDFKFRNRRKTNDWLHRVARSEGHDLGAISIVFCSDEYLLGINRDYLKHDYYTDIITFDYCDSDRKILSGDLLISIDTVASNAKKYGVSFDDELLRVIVHGILHLSGYGDKSDEEARTMRAKENFYLDQRE